MASSIPLLLLGVTLFQILAPSGCRASFSQVMPSAIEHKIAAGDHLLAQTPPTNGPTRPGLTKVDFEPEAANDLQDNLKITSLPPVALQEKQKTSRDYLFEWGPWVFNLLLVIVGALQILLLRQNREETARQARDAREYNRAKLEVLPPVGKLDFSAIRLDANGRVAVKELAVRIANYGYTEATNVEARGGVLTGDNVSEVVPIQERLHNIPSIIKRMVNSDTVDTTDAIPLYLAQEGYMTSVPQVDVDKLLNSKTYLRLVGSVTYDDAYGYHHEAPFEFRGLSVKLLKGVWKSINLIGSNQAVGQLGILHFRLLHPQIETLSSRVPSLLR